MTRDASLLQRQSIEWKGVKLEWARLAALSGDRVVLVEGRDLLMVLDLSASRGRVTHVQRLRWSPQTISLSPSGRFVLLSASRGNYATLWDLEAGQGVFELAAPESIAATVARFRGEELLLFSREPGVLEALALPSLDPLFRVELDRSKPFVFSSIFVMPDEGRCFVSGHRYLEMSEELASFSLADAFSDAGRVARAIDAPTSIQGTRIVHGASSRSECVTLVERDETNAALYLGETCAVLTTANEHTGVMATDRALIVGRKNALHLSSRKDLSAEPLSVRTRGYGFDPAGSRLVLINTKGGVELCQVAG
jgi:hypothetical protein